MNLGDIKKWMAEAGAGPNDRRPSNYNEIAIIFMKVAYKAVSAYQDSRTEQEPVAWRPAFTHENYATEGVWNSGKPTKEDLEYWSKTKVGIEYAYASPNCKPLTNDDLQLIIYEHTKLNPNLRDDQELIGYMVNAARTAIAKAGGSA